MKYHKPKRQTLKEALKNKPRPRTVEQEKQQDVWKREMYK